MNWQNLSYALTQVLHNFGAATVVGSAVFALWHGAPLPRKLAWGMALGWAVQGATGALFGAISLYHYGRFPDIHGIALTALWVKILCTLTGFGMAVVYVRNREAWGAPRCRRWWRGLFGLAALALGAAAFLRWFS